MPSSPLPLRRITVLSGGVGGARFLQGLLHGLRTGAVPGGSADTEVTVVANTADDWWIHGLKVCPDLDTVMYTLGEGIDVERGWGRREETWSAKTELEAYGVEPTWFGLGRPRHRHPPRPHPDARGRLHAVAGDRGAVPPLADAAARSERPPPADERRPGRDPHRHRRPRQPERAVGHPLPGVLGAAARRGARRGGAGRRPGHLDPGARACSRPSPEADLVVLPPSNPVVSVGTILGVPGIRDALRATSAPVVGLSPIVGDSHVHGMAAQMLTSIGVEVSAGAVGVHYGARSARWGPRRLAGRQPRRRPGRRASRRRACARRPSRSMMTDLDATADMAAAAVSLVAGPRDPPRGVGARRDARGRRGRRPGRRSCSAALGEGRDLADGDVVSVTSKVVSKAEGRTRVGDREAAIDEETVRVVARRGATRIVRHRLGLTMAAAGVDASNVAVGIDRAAAPRPGRLGPHPAPRDPPADRAQRRGHRHRHVRPGVARGPDRHRRSAPPACVVAEDFAGRTDPHGNPLAVTLPAVADELAGAAELVQGKLAGRPVAVLRGRADLVLPPGEDGPGAASLVRPDGADLFGWGAREAVVRALAGDVADLVPLRRPAPRAELAAALDRLPDGADRDRRRGRLLRPRLAARGLDRAPATAR